MIPRNAASLSVLAALMSAGPAFAQDAAPPAASAVADPAPASDEPPPQVSVNGEAIATDSDGDGIDDEGSILVLATRLRGQVTASQPPIITLDEEDVASYGAGSIQELLAALAPQTGSGRGRGDGGPVVLLNGMRISGFREMRGLPPEAIRRVEVLPEEVALKFGYRPDQRVVNFILKDNYNSFGSETDVNLPARGGYSNIKEEATLAKIDKGSRLNITGTYERQSPLTEGERGIVQAVAPVAGSPDPADFRTLTPSSRSAAINATLAKPLGGGAGLTVNALVQRDASDALNGLRITDPTDPLATTRRTTTISAGAAINKPLGAWQLSVTADGSHVASESFIDTNRTLATDRAMSKSDSVTSLATISGSPLRLPGGEVSLTGKTGFAWSGITSNDTRGLVGETSLKRGDAQAGFSLDVPITSRRENVGAGVGNLSVNFNGEVHHLSDFGELYSYGAGLTWQPTEKLTLSGSYIASEKAPGLSDLGGPTTVTPGVTVYDFSTGQTVLATVTSGGNAALKKEKQRDIKLAANWDLPFLKNSSLLVEYFRNHSSDTTNAFPLLTPAVEAAFPGRVVRDAATGQIISIDQSPVTFADERSSRLRVGINLSGNFGKPDPNARQGRFGGMAGMGGGYGGRPPGGLGGGQGGSGAGRMRGGGPGGPGGGDGRGRWNLSLTHTIQFTDTVQIAPGGPVLDLLNGDAITGGGAARHSFQLEGGGFYRGFGLRGSANYAGGTHINASGLPGSTRLDFAPIATVNMRIFADLGRMPKLVEKVSFLKGSRISLGIDNLFDAQQRVTDGNGATPLRYQPGYLDPAGRVIKLEFRKQF